MLVTLTALATAVTLVTSGGSLTNLNANAEVISTVRTLSATSSAFYKTTIVAEEYDLVAEAQRGTNYIDSISFDFITTTGRRATLVAPNVAVGCEHYHHNVGDDMIFGSHTAKVVRVVREPIADTFFDYCFMELDRDLPIEPVQLAPTNWPAYFDIKSSNWQYDNVPIVIIDRNSVAKTTIIAGVSWNFRGAAIEACGLGLGDSGSPCFLIIEGKPVMVGVAVSIKQFTSPYLDLIEIDSKRRFL